MTSHMSADQETSKQQLHRPRRLAKQKTHEEGGDSSGDNDSTPPLSTSTAMVTIMTMRTLMRTRRGVARTATLAVTMTAEKRRPRSTLLMTEDR